VTKEKVLKIAEKCLDEMYRKSDPPLTWKEYVEKYSETKIEGFRDHKLDKETLHEIWDKHEKKVDRLWKTAFNMMVFNYSPVS